MSWALVGSAQTKKIKQKLADSISKVVKKDKQKDSSKKTAQTDSTKKSDQTDSGKKTLADQLSALKNPAGLDENAKPQKLNEIAVAGTKQETKEQGKTVDGAPVTYVTTTERFKASAAFDQQILLNPGTDVIYPGSVLLGDSIASGTYKEVITGKKNSITVSYDLTNIKAEGKTEEKTTGKVSGTITPSLANYRSLHNEIMGQSLGKASTTYSFEETTIYSDSDFSVKFNFGVGFNSGIVETNVKTGFDFSRGSKKYKYMVKFMQTFYTVDVDQGSFLYESFDVKDFNGYRPVYVSSVAYGRLAYLTIESDETWSKIKADLDVAVDASMYGKYDAKIETTVNNLKKNNKINITVIGGSDVVTNLDGFLNMIQANGFSRDNPGKIIAYKLRFVDDNSVANTVYNDEYTVTKTSEVPGKGIDTTFTLYKIKTNANDGNGKTLELYGNIDVTDGTRKNSFWSLPRSARKKFAERGESSENAAVSYNASNENAAFDFSVEIFEADGSASDDDRFTNAMGSVEGNIAKKITLSNLQDGQDIVIRTNAIKKGKSKKVIESDWVEFYIKVGKKYKY